METPGTLLHPHVVSSHPWDRILGNSAAAVAVRTFGQRAASVDAPVLLLGESGTGKGVLARAIHDASARARGPFVPINCAAVPEALFESEFFGHVRGAFTGAQYAHKGLFEQAQGGTLFLDEIGELALTAQAKLLTALEDRQARRVGSERPFTFDVRIVAATAADLPRAVADRAFRSDLYHRLRVLHLTMPPLRARHGDIALLANVFLNHFAQRYHKGELRLSERALMQLERATWPGNIRELAHALEAATLACEDGVIEGVPIDSMRIESPAISPAPSVAARRLRYSYDGTACDEQRMIDIALMKCHGNKTRAAAELGMSRNTLLNKLRRRDRSA